MPRRILERGTFLTCDVVSVAGAFLLTCALLRPGAPLNSTARWAYPPNPGGMWHVMGLWICIALWAGIHRRPSPTTRWEHLTESLHATFGLFVSVIVANFLLLQNGVVYSRSFTVVFAPVSLLLIINTRLIVSVLLETLSERWRGRLAVLGYGDDALSVLQHLKLAEREAVRGLILPAGKPFDSGAMPVLGTTRDLAAVINRERLDRIVLLNGSLTEPEMERFSEISSRMGVTVSCAMPVTARPSRVNYSVHYGIPLLDINPVVFTAAERMVKRAFDIAGSAAMLLLVMPFMLLIAFLVKITSDGPIFFTAPRVGRGGRYFTFLKFRTMYTNTSRAEVVANNEKQGHIFKVKNDPRVTPIGRFLRRYSLDELPQLINVLLGDMSLVGPRPLPIEDMEPDGMSRRFAIWSEQRASVPPGITGLWQVRGRSELSFADLVKYDLEYVHNWSLGLDLKILLQTPRLVVSGKGAY